ncbi:putative ribokinase [Coemansia spiralis]|nr:putative ribokinase [Coemansia spiralis]
MQHKIVILASINIDEVYRVPHVVRPGETISSTRLQRNAGGKGANASVAAARAGARVCVVGKIGADGHWVRNVIAGAGADVDLVAVLDDTATGRAVIQVDAAGENAIFLFPGANHKVELADVQPALADCAAGDWLLLTNETTAVAEVISYAHRCGVQVLWNPAPMPADLVSSGMPVELVDVLVLNEAELRALACQLDGLQSAEGNHADMARHIMARFGTRVVIVTLGRAGSIGLVRRSSDNPHELTEGRTAASADIAVVHMDCAPVAAEQVKDTTAAGDTWVGYFAAELVRLQSSSAESVGALAALTPAMVERAMQVATYASGITVTREGAIASIPGRAEVDAFLRSQVLHK